MFDFLKPKPAVPAITQAEHVNIVAAKIAEARRPLLAEIERLKANDEAIALLSRGREKNIRVLTGERDALAAELAAIKSRRLAPLIAANAARKEKAAQKRAEQAA